MEATRRGRRGRARPRAAPARSRAPPQRLRAANVRVEVADAASSRREGAGFDRVLVDPPCSGLGTLQARPDLRWRAQPEAVAEMARAAGPYPRAGAAALRPGGVLVYSTCTISPTENERLIAAFLDSHPDFELDDLAAEICRATGIGRRRPAGAGVAPAVRADAAPPRPHRRLLHRPAAPELSVERRARRPPPRRPIDLGPQCPQLRRAVAAAHQPARPLPLRVLPAPLRADLGVPQLRRALDDRAHVLDRDPEVQQLRRLDAAGRMSDRAARELLREVRVAPSILSADFGRLREQVGEVLAAGARVIHVDVMDGHFVPPITVGPLVVAALAEHVREAGGDARRAPDDRAPRAPASPSSSTPARTRSPSTPRPRRTSPTPPT